MLMKRGTEQKRRQNIAREGIGAANCEHNDYFSELLTYRV